MQTVTEKEVNAGLTQASDAAFINAFTADGTPIKISKADLASVVAEQNVHYNAGSSLDSINNTGIWLVNNGQSYRPTGAGDGLVCAIVFGNRRWLTYYPFSFTENIYLCSRNLSGEWTSWISK